MHIQPHREHNTTQHASHRIVSHRSTSQHIRSPYSTSYRSSTSQHITSPPSAIQERLAASTQCTVVPRSGALLDSLTSEYIYEYIYEYTDEYIYKHISYEWIPSSAFFCDCRCEELLAGCADCSFGNLSSSSNLNTVGGTEDSSSTPLPALYLCSGCCSQTQRLAAGQHSSH